MKKIIISVVIICLLASQAFAITREDIKIVPTRPIAYRLMLFSEFIEMIGKTQDVQAEIML